MAGRPAPGPVRPVRRSNRVTSRPASTRRSSRLRATFATPVAIEQSTLPVGIKLDAVERDGRVATLLVGDPDRVPAALRVLSDYGAVSLDADHGTLEEVFLNLLERPTHEEGH